ncbi:cytochrome-c peroxidase [Phototrophicus methaneseepsis]|uniref:Cytochrome-c peroxidase n=1 Tax=Phototrophicus methaneseepsis TaxID=2710758 RepID=A0A7S8E555_9CHLR|nr:cytochrome c peroxidase [Phototrophicus methaneseepsis]QPC80513.1 cytochrome-c peroxidase [Phototrophicus methaneseepsis]
MKRTPLILFLTLGVLLIFTGALLYAQEEAENTQVVQGAFATLPEEPPIPEDNAMTPEKVELGKMLYFDPRLSSSGVISCHTCHNLSLGGTDRLPSSLGHEFLTGGRNAPTVLNAAFFNLQFWDGRATGLEEQAQGPIQAGVEMAMPADMAVNRIASIEGYLPYFEAAFPDEETPITFENIAKAIATFERTLITPNDALDRYLRGDEEALSDDAKRGMEIVVQVGCIACHNGPMLSTGTLMPFRHGEDLGLATVTGEESDEFMFRVATWRNVSLTAPYFHDGSAETLEDAIRIMGSVQLNRDLTEDEVYYIVAFLESLEGEVPEITIPDLPAD